jgi:hypothetical protein
MQPNAPAVSLIVTADRDTFTIGESIRLRLRIHNPTPTAVELPGITWDDEVLAFTPPAVARLLAPDGRDLLAPYARPASFSHGAPWRVEAGKDEYYQLPITSHLALRQPGEYRFSLTLADRGGRSYTSNPLAFRLADIEASLPAGAVELRLALVKPEFRAGERIEAEAAFVNRSDKPVVFLRPQQDSFDGWANPSYLFHLTDSEGRGVTRALRCGDLATPEYGEESFFTVKPGGSATLRLRIADYPGLERPGTYRAGLTYIVRRHAVGVGGATLDREMSWLAGTFLGRLESNEATLVIR